MSANTVTHKQNLSALSVSWSWTAERATRPKDGSSAEEKLQENCFAQEDSCQEDCPEEDRFQEIVLKDNPKQEGCAQEACYQEASPQEGSAEEEDWIEEGSQGWGERG